MLPQQRGIYLRRQWLISAQRTRHTTPIYGGMYGRAADNSFCSHLVSICSVLEFVPNKVDSDKWKTWFPLVIRTQPSKGD